MYDEHLQIHILTSSKKVSNYALFIKRDNFALFEIDYLRDVPEDIRAICKVII